MTKQKYSVGQQPVETILTWQKSGEIAIPEIQRPFVWGSTKVRDLMDSLYEGYPIGYLILWRNPNARLKDGSTSEGKKIIIDGQQRIIALKAAILGENVVDDEYRKVRITISFNPITHKFEVLNPAIAKNPQWIQDVSPVITGKERLSKIVKEYCSKNKVKEEDIEDSLENLKQVILKPLGLIELDHSLDIDEVNDIFTRANSTGVRLDQADFAMSKIAVNESYGGFIIRKAIDYFCHLSVVPEFYSHIPEVDKEFTKTDYFNKMSWLKNETDDLYVPDYKDLVRVAFTSEFERGKLADLVALLAGRNFETKDYEEDIAKKSFATLSKGVLNFMNETNFKRFVMIIKSAGFISPDLVIKGSLNFAYILYLKLKSKGYHPAEIESYVRRWFVLSVLTGRYSGSQETTFDLDIRSISSKPFKDYIQSVEDAELSDTFWNVGLIQNLDTSSSSSPFFHVFLASQVKSNDKGFLSKDITVNELIAHRGDIHHIFPKDYLKKHGLKKGQYNQIANFVYMQSEINIKIGNNAPHVYFEEIKKQCNGQGLAYGGITDLKDLKENLGMNCIPDSVMGMDIKEYDRFLKQRRILMAKKIREYYYSL